MSEFEIGSTVTIGRNDAGVKAGSKGRYVGSHPETGNALVDVEGRGRVAFTLHQITAQEPAACHRVTSAAADSSTGQQNGHLHVPEPAKRTHRATGVITVGGTAITLTIHHAALAEALGLPAHQLKAIAAACGKKTQGTQAIRYTAAEVYQIHELMETMAEFEVSPKAAVKILARLALRNTP